MSTEISRRNALINLKTLACNAHEQSIQVYLDGSQVYAEPKMQRSASNGLHLLFRTGSADRLIVAVSGDNESSFMVTDDSGRTMALQFARGTEVLRLSEVFGAMD